MEINQTNFWGKFAMQLWVAVAIGVVSAPVAAQIVPDQTLGAEGSRTTSNVLIRGATGDLIEGGAVRGSNLFHSFQQFNVNANQRVFFANPVGVQNIFSRVTGSNASNILGTLGVDGRANLFLLNPHGILFGENAQLNIRGSFLATTADAVRFGDLGNFSASTPENPSFLLTVSPSALLYSQLAAQAGTSIEVQSSNLHVPRGKSLLLLGGNVSIDNSQLTTTGGRVAIGGVAAPGAVDIRVDGQDLSFTIPDGLTRSDVMVTNGSQGLVLGVGGSINIQARNLTISENSTLQAGLNISGGSLTDKAGDITANVTNTTLIDGKESYVLNSIAKDSVGTAGNIFLSTGSLLLRDGARISTGTFGRGNAGNINIKVQEGISLENGATLFSTVQEGAIGYGGNITLAAKSLELREGARLTTNSSGRGNAGKISIQAAGITLSGNGTELSSDVGEGGIGTAGGISLFGKSILIRDDANLSASTFGRGDAGNIYIEAQGSVSLKSRATLYSTVENGAIGNGGNITIKTGSLTLADKAGVEAGSQGKGDAGNVNVIAHDSIVMQGNSEIYSVVEESGLGKGGSVTLSAPTIALNSDSAIQVDNYSQNGIAGNINIQTNLLKLDQASIQAETDGGRGGDISIRGVKLLLLRDYSQISSTAGSPQQPGNGGKISIDAAGGFVIAVPNENSDIIANAFGGKGGKISISANRILGLTQRSRLTPTQLQAIRQNGISDISASSDVGADGEISTSTLQVDPSQGLTEIPVDLVDPSSLIAQNCQPGSAVADRRSEFVISGRGGLPPSPGEVQTSDAGSVPWVSSTPGVAQTLIRASVSPPAEEPVVEAQGITIAANGAAFLTTQTVTAPLHSPRLSKSLCASSNR